MSERGDDVKEPARKPLLTVEQQIAHMKSKGITFELCSEEAAAEHLRAKCQFFRIYSYRKLFDAALASGLPVENPAIAALRFLERLTLGLGLLK